MSKDNKTLHHLPDSLRGPLHGVLGAFELLLHSDLHTSQKDIAQLGRQATQELIEAIGEFDLSKSASLPPSSAPHTYQAPLNKHVLLVEDNPINRTSIAKFLKKAGFEVTVAENGAEAIELTQTTHFHLILMDIHMPILGGKEAIAAIRQELPELPIVAMTANCSKEDQTELTQIGASGFLLKPFGRELLLDTAALYCS